MPIFAYGWHYGRRKKGQPRGRAKRPYRVLSPEEWEALKAHEAGGDAFEQSWSSVPTEFDRNDETERLLVEEALRNGVITPETIA